MRKRLKNMLCIALAAVFMTGSASIPSVHAEYGTTEADAALQLYVSPEGSADGTGTLADPFDSLETARDAIRNLKKGNGGQVPEGGVTVNVRGGIYPLVSGSFELEAQDSGTADSPIVYRAYQDEEVNYVGSLSVDGSGFVPVEDEEIRERLGAYADEVLVYDLQEHNGLTEFPPMTKNGMGWPGQAGNMSVSVDGEIQTLSRYPNEGFLNISSIQQTGFVPRDHVANPDGSCPACTGGGDRIPCRYTEAEYLEQPGGIFTVNNSELVDRYDLWAQESDIWVAGYFCNDWADDQCGISNLVNTGTGIRFTTSQPHRYGFKNSGRRVYAYNLLCEIDSPGEWYLDRENAKLYLYPQKDLTDSSLELSIQSEPLIRMTEVSYVNIWELNFSNSNGYGIRMEDCDHVEIAGCDFSDLGLRAVCIGAPEETSFEAVNTGLRGGHDNTVRSCNITRMGQGGIFLGGGNRYTLTHANNKVINCDISDFATVKRTYSPAVDLYGCGNSVERCYIYDAPHAAILFHGNDHLIYGNEIYDVCYETSDVGAIYCGRRWTEQGNVIQNNYIHDLVDNSGHGSSVVYIDDMGSGVTMTENLMVNIPGKTTTFGGGRDNVITNNIQINYGNGEGYRYDNRGLGWAAYMASGPDGECYGELKALRDHEDYDADAWNEAYPGLAAIDVTNYVDGSSRGERYKYYYRNAATPANVTIANNVDVGVTANMGITGSLQNSKIENNYKYDAGWDIGFGNVAALDFTVRKDSIIKKVMGDSHFQVEKAGLYEDEFRSFEIGTLANAEPEIPADGAQDVAYINGAVFLWSPVEGAGSYTLEIATDEGLANVVKTETVFTNNALVSGLAKGTTYYWRVTAREPKLNGAQSVSDVGSFTTIDSADTSFYEGFRNFLAWNTVNGTSGNSTEQAHAGNYSYVVDEGQDAIKKDFDMDRQDVISIWLYDNMKTDNGTTAVVSVANSSLGMNCMLGVRIPPENPNGGGKVTYTVRFYGGNGDSGWTWSEVQRTEGWHELKWDFSDGTDCKVYIDDMLVGTIAGMSSYNQIQIGDWWSEGGAGNISGMFFDDLRMGTPELNANALSVTVPQEKVELYVGDTYQIEPVVETDLDVDTPLEYTSEAVAVATVDTDGVVTAVEAGTTTIIVRAPQGEKTASIELTVKYADAQTLEAAKEFVQKAVDNLSVSSATTKEDFQSAVDEALENAGFGNVVTAEVSDLNVIFDSASQGHITGSVSIRCAGLEASVAIDRNFDTSFYEGFRSFTAWDIVHGTPGNSTEQAHAGSYSYIVDEGQDAIKKSFDMDRQDVISIWLYDNMKMDNATTAVVDVYSSSLNMNCMLGVRILPNGSGKNTYTVRSTGINGGDWTWSEVQRTEGWHELKWDFSDGTDCKVYIDDMLVGTIAGMSSYNQIQIGDSWREGGAGNTSGMFFDDLRMGTPVLNANALSVTVPQDKVELYVGETYQIEPVVETDLDVDTLLEYASGAEAVADVTADGLVTALGRGTTTITVTAPRGEKTASIELTVKLTDAQTVEEAEAIVQEIVDSIAVSNDTTQEDFQSALENALENAGLENVTVTVSELSVSLADVGAQGRITGSVSIQCAESEASVVIDRSIAALAPKTYELVVISGSGSGSYEEGAEVIVTAEEQEGMVFQRWEAEGITLADAAANPLSFKMPAGAVRLTAVYQEEPGGTETPGGDTEEPGGTETPGGDTEKPGGTETPGGDTEKPGGTETPGGTEEPGGTETPGGTEKPGGTETPSDTEKPGDTANPGKEDTHTPGKTGDSMPVGIWIALAVVCGGALILTAAFRKEKES